MKKFLIILFLLIGFVIPSFADDGGKPVLPSETGLVEKIQYEDAKGLNQGEETTKQVVTVNVLT